jgi:hypothetical protein
VALADLGTTFDDAEEAPVFERSVGARVRVKGPVWVQGERVWRGDERGVRVAVHIEGGLF